MIKGRGFMISIVLQSTGSEYLPGIPYLSLQTTVMKTLNLLAALFLLAHFSSAQSISLQSDKSEYELHERIDLVYQFTPKEKSDSVLLPDFEGFNITGGPKTSQAVTFDGGTAVKVRTVKLSLRAQETGKFSIPPATMFEKGEVTKGGELQLKILKSSLSAEEQDRIGFNTFLGDQKPPGTTRVIIGVDYGYTEVFDGNKWNFQRRLTDEELAGAQKLQ